jgi:hypothetical protein
VSELSNSVEPIAEMTRERLHELCWTKNPSELREITGVTRSSQRWHARQRQVPMPPRGYFSHPIKSVPPLAPLVVVAKPPIVQPHGNKALRALSREELHQVVWAESATSVASRLELSGKGLAKRCQYLNIPVPPRGWFEQRKYGKAPPPTPLPPAPEDYDQRVKLEREFANAETRRTEGPDDLLAKGPQFVQELMQRVSKPLIRAQYGVSRHALDRYCRQHGLEVPGVGFRHPERRNRQPDPVVDSPLVTCADPEIVLAPADRPLVSFPSRPDQSPVGAAGGAPATETIVPTPKNSVLPEGLKFLGEDSVIAWLGSFPNQSSTEVRRSQLKKALGAIAESFPLGTILEFARFKDEAIKEACEKRLFNGENRNSCNAYRSMCRSYRDFFLRGLEDENADEGAGTATIDRLFDLASYDNVPVAWEHYRDLAIASLYLRDEIEAERVAEINAAAILEGDEGPRSRVEVERYLESVRNISNLPLTGPLFITTGGAPIYRELVGRRIKHLCAAAAVRIRPVHEMRRLLNRA